MIDRRLDERVSKFLDLMERGVTALESMGAAPVTEDVFMPPFCPHCETLNPTITMDGSSEGENKFSRFVLIAHCGNCGKKMFGIPAAWSMHTDAEEAKEELKIKEEILNESE